MTDKRILTAVAMFVALQLMMAGCSSSSSGVSRDSSSAVSGGSNPAACAQTTASPENTETFVFTHSSTDLGVHSQSSPAFAHVRGVVAVADPANTKSLAITISDAAGKTVATIDDLAPGATCGIDHDFAPGDYMIESSDGNGTQFSSFSDDTGSTADTASATGSSVGAAPPASSTHATLTFDGATYEFTHGACSPTLDPNLFLFRDPATPGNDATYFALTVSDVTDPSSSGGKHAGSITYQKDGKTVVAVSDATLDIRSDLGGGTFSGPDFLTGREASGSYTC